VAVGVQHVNEADAQGQPDCWASTIALTDTLEGEDIKATTVEVGAVTICCAEEELHKAEGLEHGLEMCPGIGRQWRQGGGQCCHNSPPCWHGPGPGEPGVATQHQLQGSQLGDIDGVVALDTSKAFLRDSL